MSQSKKRGDVVRVLDLFSIDYSDDSENKEGEKWQDIVGRKMAKHRRSRKKNEGVGIAQVIFWGRRRRE
jgi:hypothetical protein